MMLMQLRKHFQLGLSKLPFNLFKFLKAHISNFELKKGLSCISNVSNFYLEEMTGIKLMKFYQ